MSAAGAQLAMATEPHATSEVIVRELPPEEFDLLRAYKPFSEIGLPNPDKARPVVVQKQNGEIVGFWWVFIAAHVEPLWLAEEYRGKPGILRRMWRGVHDIIQKTGFTSAFAVIPAIDLPTGTLGMARKLGFQPVLGQLYYVNLGEGSAKSAVDQSVEKVAEA